MSTVYTPVDGDVAYMIDDPPAWGFAFSCGSLLELPVGVLLRAGYTSLLGADPVVTGRRLVDPTPGSVTHPTGTAEAAFLIEMNQRLVSHFADATPGPLAMYGGGPFDDLATAAERWGWVAL